MQTKLRLSIYLCLALLLASFNSQAGNSFRLENGRLITTGMSSIEVLDLIGEPLTRDTRAQGLSLDQVFVGKTIETWSYLITGSIGGEYYLTLIIEDGIVAEVYSKQRGRL
jgi:hypothetical protein